jgi:uncharacterized membrane protein YqjE
MFRRLMKVLTGYRLICDERKMSTNPYAAPESHSPVLSAKSRQIWTRELKSARTVLIVVGVIQLLFGIWHVSQSKRMFDEAVAAEVKAQGPGFEVDRELANQAWEEQKVLMYSLQSIPIAFAVFLFVMAALVFKFPIGVTLGSLITYIVMMIVDGYFDPSQIYKGIILKIILITVLWKAYKSARTAIEAG